MKHLLVLCLTWLPLSVHADERILDYQADIRVLAERQDAGERDDPGAR